MKLHAGETLGIVGESGCGKSTLAKTILGLIEPSSGKVYFHGKSVWDMGKRERKDYHRRVQVVFQDPYSSLDPRMTIEQVISEPFVVHREVLRGKAAVRNRVISLLESVGLGEADLARYPHEFSGGQKQRIAIARALALDPEVLICDEAVSALDVSIQAQILELLQRIKQERGIAVLFISHDLSVVRYVSDTVGVMYRGELVEFGPIKEVYEDVGHPYTRTLLNAIPRIEGGYDLPGSSRPTAGTSVETISEDGRCRFVERCSFARTECAEAHPELLPRRGRTHPDRCWRSGIWQDEEVAEVSTAASDARVSG